MVGLYLYREGGLYTYVGHLQHPRIPRRTCYAVADGGHHCRSLPELFFRG